VAHIGAWWVAGPYPEDWRPFNRARGRTIARPLRRSILGAAFGCDSAAEVLKIDDRRAIRTPLQDFSGKCDSTLR